MSLNLPNQLLSYLTYGGTLKDEPQQDKPRSLIADGTCLFILFYNNLQYLQY